MSFRNSPERWGSVSIALHWLIVVLFFVLGAVGLYMSELPLSAGKVKIYALHKSFGLTLLALVVIRLIWRLIAGRPHHLTGTPPLQRFAAAATHACLYLFLLAIPLSGWLYNSASNFPLQWFGLFNVPAIAGKSPELKEWAHEAHEWLFWLACAFIALHIAAALWHHLVKRDDTLRRMLPRWR